MSDDDEVSLRLNDRKVKKWNASEINEYQALRNDVQGL